MTAGLKTVWTGEQQSTTGGNFISSVTGMSLEHSELVYGMFGDTASIWVASKALRASQPAYRVFTSEEELRQAAPHLVAAQQDRIAITGISPTTQAESLKAPYLNAEQTKIGESLA